MRNSIDKLINRALEEEIQKKVQQFLNEDRSEWMEIDGTIDEIDEEYVDEDENLESREFVYAARKAKEQGKKTFELDGKKFDVKEKLERLHKGLHGVSESKLTQMKNDILSKKTITLKEQNLLEQINTALDLKKMNSQNNKLRISESELLDLIESIVLEKKTDKRVQKLTEEEFTKVVRKIVTTQINEVSDLDNMDKKTPF
jgi:hypothetical protein